MTFECVSCGAEVRFGASECRSCELGYRYLDGIAVPELAHPEPEQLGEAVEQEAGTHVQPPSASLVATTIVAVLSSSVLAVTSIALSPILEVVTKLSGSSASPGQAFLITALNVGAGLTTFGATFAAATLFLFWMHSTNRCLRSLGVGSLRFTPGWCVGWWFVPLASLVNPYQAMVELWKASRHWPKLDWTERSRSSLLPWWWACWLVCDLASGFELTDILAGDYHYSGITMFRMLLSLPAALLCSFLVFEIHRNLERAAARRQGPLPIDFEPFRSSRDAGAFRDAGRPPSS